MNIIMTINLHNFYKTYKLIYIKSIRNRIIRNRYINNVKEIDVSDLLSLKQFFFSYIDLEFQ